MSGKQFSLDSHIDMAIQTSLESCGDVKDIENSGRSAANAVAKKKQDRDSILEDEESVEGMKHR